MSRTQREPPLSQPIIDSDLGRADSLEIDAPTQLKQGRFRSHGAELFLLGADLSAVAITVAIFFPDSDLWIGLVFSALVMLGFAQVGLYRSCLTLSILDDLPTISGRVLVAAGIAWILVAVSGFDVDANPWMFAIYVSLLLAARSLAYQCIYFLRSRRIVRKRLLIVGAGVVGNMIGTELLENRRYGMKLVGFIDEDPLVNVPARVAPILGGYDDIATCVEQLHIDHIVIAFSSIPGASLIDVIREADRLDCEISNVPRLFEISATPPGNDEIGGIPLIRLRRSAFRSPVCRSSGSSICLCRESFLSCYPRFSPQLRCSIGSSTDPGSSSAKSELASTASG